MKKSIVFLFILSIFSFATFAQVHVDKPINLNGGTGQRSITNLEAPVNGTDAVNKDYVDAFYYGDRYENIKPTKK